MQQITTEQMWQAVAEKIEPKPSGHICNSPYVYTYSNAYKCPACLYRGLRGSFQYWFYNQRQGWHVRPYDAEMCLMLLKRLPWPEIVRFKDEKNEGWMVTPHWDRPSEYAVEAELEEAILAAAYKSICETVKS